MQIFLIGASRNIGYLAALRFLSEGHTCYFLLRNPSAWDADEGMQVYIKSGKAKTIKGDALKSEDVANGWKQASEDGPVDLVVFSLGQNPNAGNVSISLTKGFLINPADLCTRSFRNVLDTMPDTMPQPRFVVVTSGGLGSTEHQHVSFLMKPLYSWGLRAAHADKMGVERILSHSTAFGWSNEDPIWPEILEEGWEKTVPAPGTLKNVVIVRPAWLTDGVCRADTNPDAYRAGEVVPSQWTVSRSDVAHFIAEKCLKNWEEWNGKRVTVAY